MGIVLPWNLQEYSLSDAWVRFPLVQAQLLNGLWVAMKSH